MDGSGKTIEFLGLMLAFAVQFGAVCVFFGVLFHRVKVLERDLVRDTDAQDKRMREMETREQRDDGRILREIEKLEHEMREGIVYLGSVIANLSATLSEHEFRLSRVEKAQGVSTDRMPQARPTPPRPPHWMPASSHASAATAVEKSGGYDPKKDPRSR